MDSNHSNDDAQRGDQSLDNDGKIEEGSIKSDSSSVKSSPPRPSTPSSCSEEPTTTASTTPDGYDSERIPSSVFASKSGNGIDWSNASNESLFSIYMGNNSFSRDQIAMLYKSGELPMLDQPPSSPSTWQPPLPPSSPLRRNAPINIVHVHVHVPANNNNNNDDDNNINNDNNNFITTTVPPQVVLPPSPPAVNSTPPVTRNSTTSSTRSFQFPIFPQEQMERNSTQKVGAVDQNSDKKSEDEDQRTGDEDEKQAAVAAGEQQQQNQPEKGGAAWKSCFGLISCFSCLPCCFPKPNDNNNNNPPSSS